MINPSASTEKTNNGSSAASTASSGPSSTGMGASSTGPSSASSTSSRPLNQSSDAASIADAIEQMKLAAASVYEAVGTLRGASASAAKHKLDEGKVKAQGLEAQAESAISEKPLLYLGAAFAAGWLVSKIMKSS